MILLSYCCTAGTQKKFSDTTAVRYWLTSWPAFVYFCCISTVAVCICNMQWYVMIHTRRPTPKVKVRKPTVNQPLQSWDVVIYHRCCVEASTAYKVYSVTTAVYGTGNRVHVGSPRHVTTPAEKYRYLCCCCCKWGLLLLCWVECVINSCCIVYDVQQSVQQ